MRWTISLLTLAWGTWALAAEVPVDSTVSYQGRLTDGGNPADGEYDMRFSLYDAATGGNRIGPILIFDGLRGNRDPIDVNNGLFSTGLNFGDGVFTGNALWLEIQVRPHGIGSYVTLSPRQPLYAVPYALYALAGPGSGGGFWSASGSHIYNTNGGSVGIGTTNPGALLDVAGGILSSSASGGVLMTRNPNNQTASFSLGWLNDVARLRIGGDGPGAGGGLDIQRTGDRSLMRILHNGRVGVGTVDPAGLFSVVSSSANGVSQSARITRGGNDGTALVVEGPFSSTDGRSISVYATTDKEAVSVLNDASGDGGRFSSRGGTGVIGFSANGNGVNGYSNIASGYGGVFGSLETPGKGLLVVGESHLFSPVGIGTFTVPSGVMLAVDGVARVNVLEIVGADLAEKFPVSDEPTPGMVVEIDPDHAGTLRIAKSGAYNARVAGVVSGANDLSVGAVLGNLPGHEDAPPIALSGRVWVYCDASTGAIEPGDLLTTSNTPGHAMKAADRARAYGATIGKAMSSLKEGQGMVLVLVSLQ